MNEEPEIIMKEIQPGLYAAYWQGIPLKIGKQKEATKNTAIFLVEYFSPETLRETSQELQAKIAELSGQS